MNQQPWDARYQSTARLFSGLPNPTLVTEVADLAIGRALDIGCGEGADALWLAERGWTVTAIDIAPTALDRAAQTTSDVARRIRWIECDITQDRPPRGPFDLVTMHFTPLLTEEADRVVSRIVESVGPGGTLLFVTHDIRDLTPSGDFDPDRYCQPADIANRLGPDWAITVDEKRRRSARTQGTRHTHDAILRARRGD